MLADTANLLLDLGGSTTTTGSGNAYLLALDSAPTAYADNLFFLATSHHTNTGPATLNVNGIGVKAIEKIVSGTPVALSPADFPVGHIGMFTYSTANNSFVMLTPATSAFIGSTLAIFPTNDDATAATIPSTAEMIIVLSHATPGDDGGGTYKREATLPGAGQGLFFQSADGAYWVYQPDARGYNARAAGLRYDGGSNQLATSTTSLTVGGGTQVITTQSGKDFVAGDYVRVAATANPSGQSMLATVTSYAGTTLTVSVVTIVGSGTVASWTIELDDTPHWQDLIDAYPIGGTIYLRGLGKCGTLTFPIGQPYQFEIEGTLHVPIGDIFTLPDYTSMNGFGGSTGAQFHVGPSCAVSGQVRMQGVGRTTLQNVRVMGWTGGNVVRNAGIELYGGALNEVRNCSAEALAGDATSVPFMANSAFWTWVSDCSFLARSNTYPASMLFTDEGDAVGSYNGLHFVRQTRLDAYGVKILQKAGADALASAFYFHQVERENAVSGTALFDVENNGSSVVSLIKVTDPAEYDQSGTTAWFNFSGTGSMPLTVEISGHDTNIPLFLPGSKMPQRIVENGITKFDYGTLFTGGPTPNVHYYSLRGGIVDARLRNPPTAPQALPFTPLPVLSPADFAATASSGGIVTTGVLAEDGTASAVSISGAHGGYARAYSGVHTLAVGDYLFIGCKIRATEADLLPMMPGILLSGGAIEGGATYNLGGNYEPRRDDGRGWFTLVEVARITSIANPTTIYFTFTRLVGFSITAYDQWCLGIIPASAGMTDGTIARLARSLTPWPNVGAAGRVALPTRQHLQLSMAWNAGHIIDEAGNHLWMNAGTLYTKASAPSSGTDGTVVGAQT